jgi:hypothetical protein
MLKLRTFLGPLFALALVVSSSACATAPETAHGPRIHAAAADTQPTTPRVADLQVLMDNSVTDTTPSVSNYKLVNKGLVGMQLVTTGTLQGAWKIEVSCSPTAVVTVNTDTRTQGLSPTIAAANDDPSDITSAFSPSIAAVTTASSQYVQLDALAAGYLRVTFTATSGSGRARVNLRN